MRSRIGGSSDRSGCGYGLKPYFAIFLNERSPHTGGDRGKRSAERAPLGDGGNASHSRCFGFQWERDRGAVITLMTAGRPCPPAPSVAPVKAPLTRGFCFLSPRPTMLAAIGCTHIPT